MFGEGEGALGGRRMQGWGAVVGVGDVDQFDRDAGGEEAHAVLESFVVERVESVGLDEGGREPAQVGGPGGRRVDGVVVRSESSPR